MDDKRFEDGCAYCGKPDAPVRQVPAPVPFSDRYCDDPVCVQKCFDDYIPAWEAANGRKWGEDKVVIIDHECQWADGSGFGIADSQICTQCGTIRFIDRRDAGVPRGQGSSPGAGEGRFGDGDGDA